MTDAVTSGVVRETLYSTDGTLRVSGLVREVLRSSGAGSGTYLVADGFVREVLRSADSVAASGMVIVMA